MKPNDTKGGWGRGSEGRLGRASDRLRREVGYGTVAVLVWCRCDKGLLQNRSGNSCANSVFKC